MKKTFTINLNNIVFHIDDDAYELLQSYLAEVGNHLKSESEKADIMNDIEARIAELFTERMDRQKNVITIEDVDAIITIMGKPSQFVDTDEEESSYSSESASADNEQAKTGSKKYYRDVDNRLLGGVASGLAAYLNWDIALVRVIFLVLAFITSGTFVLIYLLMWIIVPKAVTAAQKLEMKGEDVNIETIKNIIVDAKEYVESDKFKESANSIGNRFVEILTTLVKVVLTFVGAVVGIVGVIAVVALIIGLIIFLLEPEAIAALFPEFFAVFGSTSPDKVILFVISLVLIIGTPVFALIYWSLNTISKDRKNKYHTGLWISLGLWLVGIILFVATGAGTLRKLIKHQIDEHGTIWFWDNDMVKSRKWDETTADFLTQEREVPAFHAIEVSSAINVELRNQVEQSLSVRTLVDYQENIKTEVVNGVLKIYSSNTLIRPSVKVQIGLDSIAYLKVSGASKVAFLDNFNVKKLNIDISGASKTELKLNSAQKLDVKVSGASKLEAQGVADTLLLNSTGASKVDADDLRTKVSVVDLSGASSADVHTTEEFQGSVSGASRIEVSGNPAKRSNSTSGGSSIRYDD
ncbi:MAG TPA: PspC domain-containing protein [Bacteroidales bacterium]|nr:PspC domain-containing protein [Bacteroidales bacterium]